jgi:hypothetical protein
MGLTSITGYRKVTPFTLIDSTEISVEHTTLMHSFNVATVDCSYMFRLLKLTIIRLHARSVKRKLFYMDYLHVK